MKRLFPLLLATPLLVSACSSPSSGEKAVPRDRLIEIYLDLLDAAGNDSTATALSPSALAVLEKHGVTPEQFRGTVRAYGADPAKWRAFFGEAVKRAEERARNEMEMQGTPGIP